MINKVTNTHCRSKIIFFLLTLYKSLKTFLSGTSNAIFFTSAFFNAYRRRSGKWSFGARPVGKMTTKFCHFTSRCCIFFLSSWFLSKTRDKSETNTIDGKHLEELKSKSLPWQDSRWVPSLASAFVFWMSSSRKPACPWFWLKQELRVKGEKVRYFNIQVSFVAFRSNARVRPQQTPFSDSDERMVAEMSRDCKYITTDGFKHTLFTTFSEQQQQKNNDKKPNNDFTLQTKTSACCFILNTHTY